MTMAQPTHAGAARKPYLPEASRLPPYFPVFAGCICPDNGENGAIVALYGVLDSLLPRFPLWLFTFSPLSNGGVIPQRRIVQLAWQELE